MRKTILISAVIAGTIMLGACGDNSLPNNKPIATPSPTASTTPAATASPNSGVKTDGPENKTDAKDETLVGKWTGVEGTYLNITQKDDGKFSVEIKDLDGTQTFDGTAKDSLIEFSRKGKTETVKHATGEETGMKYLLNEKNCVVITKGSEGYCRK
jgi:hypothetical protein